MRPVEGSGAAGCGCSPQVLPHYDKVQRFKMGGVLDDLQSLGFMSQSGIYVGGPTMALAETSERLFLDDYRNYDSMYLNPKHWFSSMENISRSMLMPCHMWSGVFVGNVSQYLYFTKDRDGVNMSGGEPSPRCSDGYWWLAPACRGNSSSCIPCLTGAAGTYVYGAEEIMSKAVAWSMPMALAAADAGTSFGQIVTQQSVLFYFWETLGMSMYVKCCQKLQVHSRPSFFGCSQPIS